MEGESNRWMPQGSWILIQALTPALPWIPQCAMGKQSRCFFGASKASRKVNHHLPLHHSTMRKWNANSHQRQQRDQRIFSDLARCAETAFFFPPELDRRCREVAPKQRMMGWGHQRDKLEEPVQLLLSAPRARTWCSYYFHSKPRLF